MLNIKPCLAAVAAAATLFCSTALAQPVTRIVVQYDAGGPPDVYARSLAQEMSKSGAQVIVENKTGASGVIAAQYVAKARPDGHTLLLGANSTIVFNTVLFEKLSYDPLKDFTPVSLVGYQPNVLYTRIDAPFATLREMVSYAKANPGKLNRASVGVGTITNLAGMMFEKTAGITTTHVPYSGQTPVMQALLGGQVDISFGAMGENSLALVRGNKLRLLGVMDATRQSQAPAVPTFKESGYDVESYAWYGLFAPAGTPSQVVDKINRQVNQILAQEDFVARGAFGGINARGGSPSDLERFIKAEFDRWVPVLKSVGLKTGN